jgi:poly-gamma-glutamate capsule biosynthesis protein CapA/YwtB (metallophosphatase superfamily)
MTAVSKSSQLLLGATSLLIMVAAATALWPQSPALSIILTGQSLIRTDMRVHAPSAMPTIAQLLKGDVVFTNFEATVMDRGQSLQPGKVLSPPETLEALKDLGFNLLALSNNHAFDLKVSGIQNTLQEVSRLNLAHA